MAEGNDALRELIRDQGIALHATLEISDRCNEVCVHCYQVQGQKGEMTTSQVREVLGELASSGVLFLTISGGEATLRPDFLEIVASAREQGFVVDIFTNGLTMSPELASELYRLAVRRVEISLYSHQAQTHDFVTGVRGSFERTTGAIRSLVAAGVAVVVKTPIMAVNEAHYDKYMAFVEELGATVTIDAAPLIPREGGVRAPQAFNPSDDFMRGLRSDPRFDLPEGPVDAPLQAPICGAGGSIHIEPNGELRPCAVLELDLGNVMSRDREAQQNGERRRAQLKALTWQNLPGCRVCDLHSYCERCHAAALSEAGDALAPYSTACRHALLKYELRLGVRPQALPGGGRGAEQGPYRHLGGHRFQAIGYERTGEDEALASQLGWTRRADTPEAPPQSARPGQLVQLRRPGQKYKREAVPGVPR